MIRFILILYVCVLSVLRVTGQNQNLGFQLTDGRKKVHIPIEVHNNLIVVPVVLNDALPLKFILDTGVRTTILTQKTFADILNLAYSRKYTIPGHGGQSLVDAYVTNNVSLELPGVAGRGHAMLVLGEDYLELRNYLGTDVHGILGYELFSRFIIQIDYEKRLMTLMLPEKFHKSRRYQAIPISIEDTKPYVSATVAFKNGKVLDAKLLMDSGASHGLMLEPTSHPDIDVPENSVSSLIGRGLGGEIVGKVGRIASISVGDFKLDGAIANFPDPNTYTDSIKVGSVFRNGAIGGEILSRFVVIFNFPAERVYLKKNSSFKKNFYYNLSGITLKAKGSQLTTFEVMEVRDQSPSKEGGIRAGDIIVTLNGIPVQNLDLNMMNSLLNSKPGKRIRLELLRKGERFKTDIELQDPI